MTQRFLLGLGAAVVVALVFIVSSLFVVTETQSAIVLQFGEPRRVVTDPGLHMKLPFVQNVVYLDKRTLNLSTPAEEVIASDQRRLVVDSFARFRIVDPLLFYQRVGTEDVARSRLGTLINSGLRQVLGSEPFRSVLSDKRPELMRKVRELVNPEVTQFGVHLVDMRIRRADLPEANSQAIFRRMQTDREQEAKEYRAQGYEEAQRIRSTADRQRTVLLAEAQRESQITRAQGDAEAARIASDTYGRDPTFYAFYRSMQAYRVALTKETTTLVLSPASPFLRFLGSTSGMDAAINAAANNPDAAPIPIPSPNAAPPLPGTDLPALPGGEPLVIDPGMPPAAPPPAGSTSGTTAPAGDPLLLPAPDPGTGTVPAPTNEPATPAPQ